MRPAGEFRDVCPPATLRGRFRLLITSAPKSRILYFEIYIYIYIYITEMGERLRRHTEVHLCYRGNNHTWI